MTTTSECPICCESVSKTAVCPYCQYISCSICWKTFIHSKTDTQCISCNHILTIYDLSSMFPMSYIHGEYREYTSNILFEKHRPLLKEAEKEQQKKELQRQIGEEMKHLQKELYDIKIEIEWKKINKEDIENSKNRKRQIKQEYEELKYKKQNVDNILQEEGCVKCPRCQDRILRKTQNYFCDICQLYTCIDCQKTTPSHTDHICDTSDLETQKILKEQTRPCPGCESLIYKTDGCSQMWCSQCHTTFDWNTMEIEKYRIHNPHFYEYQKQLYNGEIPAMYDDNKKIVSKEEITFAYNCIEEKAKLEFMQNLRNHLDYIEDYLIKQLAHEFDVFDIPVARKRFVEKRMKESVFKNALWRMEKRRQKENKEKRVLQKLIDNCSDTLYELAFFDIDIDEALKCLFMEYDVCDKDLIDISQKFKLPPIKWK
jgi:hypothetical protein